jgi:hypothetical protein
MIVNASGSASNVNREGPGSAFASFQAVADPIVSLPDGFVPEADIEWGEGEPPRPILWSEAFAVEVTPGVIQSVPEAGGAAGCAAAVALVLALRAALDTSKRRT